ncbi:unknown [Prevotella sp. CAG:474]|nr:unknown [Prevotella sp. CAG:474]
MIYRRLIVNKVTAKVAKKIIILFLPHLFLYSGPADTVCTSVSTSVIIVSQ